VISRTFEKFLPSYEPFTSSIAVSKEEDGCCEGFYREISYETDEYITSRAYILGPGLQTFPLYCGSTCKGTARFKVGGGSTCKGTARFI
jgi:hypothetical protein